MPITKPMLAVDAKDVSNLRYPVLASPKLDGIRCLKVGGHALSRKFKPIPNNFIRSWLERYLPDGIDGELICGNNFQDCQSGVMSIGGEPDFTYWVFDLVTDVSLAFRGRFNNLAQYIALQNSPEFMKRVRLVPHQICNTPEELMAFEEWCVKHGYEGTMVRSVDGPYKNGRSTLREGFLLKIKRWEDSEGVITGFEEQMENQNEATVDELGHTKRSSHQENKVPKNTLGAFILDWNGNVLKCGSGLGLTAEMRKQIWDHRDQYMGKLVTFKWQPHGVKDLPRFPIFKGFRSPDDISE